MVSHARGFYRLFESRAARGDFVGREETNLAFSAARRVWAPHDVLDLH